MATGITANKLGGVVICPVSIRCRQLRPAALRALDQCIEAALLFLEIALASWEEKVVAVAEALQDGLDITDGELQRLY